MKFKNGVILEVNKEISKIFPVIDQIWKDHGQEAVITAGIDGKHMSGSKHYKGDAIDLRTRYFTELEVISVIGALREKLGNDYDIVLHSTHIHIEYDPK